MAGERVVEAVFGYSRSVVSGLAGSLGHGAGADRVVLLRWRATEPEPEIRVGGWIADVTYERNKFESDARSKSADAEFVPVTTPPPRPLNENEPAALRSREYQRCHWYQIVRKSTPVDGPTFGDTSTLWRSMTVTVNRPLQAKTLLVGGTGPTAGFPFHVNAALVSPYVVNVFPKSFNAR